MHKQTTLQTEYRSVCIECNRPFVGRGIGGDVESIARVKRQADDLDKEVKRSKATNKKLSHDLMDSPPPNLSKKNYRQF